MIREELREAISSARHLSRVEEIYGVGEGPGIVRVATIDDLGQLLVEVSSEMELSPSWAQSIRVHENQHARAARILGASEIDFIVKFSRISSATNPYGKLYVGAATRTQFPTPPRPLVDALITSYPGSPSDSDQCTCSNLATRMSTRWSMSPKN